MILFRCIEVRRVTREHDRHVTMLLSMSPQVGQVERKIFEHAEVTMVPVTPPVVGGGSHVELALKFVANDAAILYYVVGQHYTLKDDGLYAASQAEITSVGVAA